jgi:hypothetical protein
VFQRVRTNLSAGAENRLIGALQVIVLKALGRVCASKWRAIN